MSGGLWEVVGTGGGAGGITVRSSKDLNSPEADGGRLSTGSLIAELEVFEDRLRFSRISGSGPDTGWVSFRARGYQLIARAGEQGTAAALEAASKAEAKAMEARGEDSTPNIWLMSQGTRGDVQPLVVLGQALRRKGYRIKVLASKNFKGFVESYGLRFLAHGVDIQSQIQGAQQKKPDKKEVDEWTQKMKEDKDAMGQDLISTVINEEVITEMARVFADALQAERPDLIMFGNLMYGLPLFAWSKYGIPIMHVTYFPIWLNTEEAMRDFHADWARVDRETIAPVTGMASVGDSSFEEWFAWYTSPRMCMTAHSPLLLRLSSGDFLQIGSRNRGLFTGFWFLNEAEQMVDLEQFGGIEGLRMMQRFLDAGRPPIYVGWGSMPIDAGALAKALLSIKQAGQRGIVVGGWMGSGLLGLEEWIEEKMPEDPLGIVKFARKNVLFVKSAPHGWLFPRCAATVHHGGAGTTAAALYAGVPTIITPFSFDQMYHADWVVKLGCGLQLNLAVGGMVDSEWTKAMKRAAEEEALRTKAREIAESLRRELGVVDAVARVEAVLADRRGSPEAVGAEKKQFGF